MMHERDSVTERGAHDDEKVIPEDGAQDVDKTAPERGVMMLNIRRAGVAEIPLIRALAQETFPAAYREILTPGQIDYMMDWMYSEESLLRQMTADGHVYLLGYKGDEAVGYVSFQREDEAAPGGTGHEPGGTGHEQGGTGHEQGGTGRESVAAVPGEPDAGVEFDRYHLQKIYVLPRMQGRGYGKMLFEAAVAAIREEHPEPFRLELNVNRQNSAVGFYQRLGMRCDRQGDFPIGGGYFMNDFIMALDVPGVE